MVDPSLISRAEALTALVRRRLPVDVTATGPSDAWALVANGLLAHATGTVGSIFILGRGGYHNDASRLLRSLYDHVTTFAWLAADPSAERLGTWRLKDLDTRLKADAEAQRAGEALLEDATRAQMQAELASAIVSIPDLASMAFAADRYWNDREPAIEHPNGLRSFRGLYTVLFRQHSGLVHATFRGLNHVTIDLSPTGRRVVLQAPLDGDGPYGVATVVYGLGLRVAGHSLGWPTAGDVDAAFAR